MSRGLGVVAMTIAGAGCNAVFGLDEPHVTDGGPVDAATDGEVDDGGGVDAPCREFVATGRGTMVPSRQMSVSDELFELAGAEVEFEVAAERAAAVQFTDTVPGVAHLGVNPVPTADAYTVRLSMAAPNPMQRAVLAAWSQALSDDSAALIGDGYLAAFRRVPNGVDQTAIYIADDIAVSHRAMLVQCVSEFTPPDGTTVDGVPAMVTSCTFLLADHHFPSPGGPYTVSVANIVMDIAAAGCP